MKFFIQKLFSKIIYRIRLEDFPKLLSLLIHISFDYSKKNKSILTFNTHDQSGGASKIAYKLTQYSRTFFINNFFTGKKNRKEDWIYEIPKMKENELTSVLYHLEKKGTWLDFSKLGALQLRKNKLFQQASVLHFHNLHGYYFSYVLLPILGKGKKVVWTLHDDHILTGHCSFTMKCDRWKIGCGNCPSLEVYPAIQLDNTKQLLYWKKKWINQLNPIIVSPSQWLADRVKISYPMLTDVRVINNGIDIDIFLPNDKQKLRQELLLPQDKFLVLFVAEFSTDNPFKGGEVVREIINRNQEESICFLTIGSENKSANSNHIEIPYISKDEELAKLYAACDILFYPTNADNFPLVVLEAMSCGLPVVASEIGGISEIIDDNFNGFMVEAYSEITIYENKLADVFNNRDSASFKLISLNARKTIVEKYSLKMMFKNYELLYRSLLK